MQATEQLFEELAGTVLDGGTVDWVAAESGADADSRPIVQHLRLLASVAQVHRDLVPVEEGTILVQAATPDRWGHLQLLERIGQGAFGEVFRAWDSRLDREVALKLLPTRPSSDSDVESSIIREGRLLAKVRHPNVVTIYGAEQIGDRIGLWMEFVGGHTLEQLLRQKTVFDAPAVAAIGTELCRAVAAVHAAGLLHRDIKAHNVMRAEDGRIVLMDFGAGRELADSSASDLAGTPLYLAPEVLAGGPATVGSDVYSLGVLLYHLVTGSYPVRGRSIREVRQAHERNDRIGVRTVRQDVRPALARVIERAIDLKPERRYENVEALARDLEALQRRTGSATLRYGLTAAALLLIGLLGLEIRARLSGDQPSPGSRLVYLIAGAPSPVDDVVGRLIRPMANWLGLKPAGMQHGCDAFDPATRGKYEEALSRYERRMNEGVIPPLDEVTKKFPRCAPAVATLAIAYFDQSFFYPDPEGKSMRPSTAAARMEPLIRRALDIDPTLSEAHSAQGLFYALTRRWEEAEASFTHAIALGPRSTKTYVDFVLSTLLPWGRLEESVDILEAALDANPGSRDLRARLADVQRMAGLYDKALENCRVVAPQPRMPAFYGCAWSLYFSGRTALALEQFEAFAAAQPERLGVRGVIHAIHGQRAEAERNAAKYRDIPQPQADIYALLGDTDRALEALERLAEEIQNPVWAGIALNHPALGLPRNDSRIVAFRRKLGFPDQ
jgi:serine/threonine-protein kinase